MTWHEKCSTTQKCSTRASVMPTAKRKSFGTKILFKNKRNKTCARLVFCHLWDMKNNNTNAKQAFRIWFDAVKAGQSEAITVALFAEYTALDNAERANARSFSRIETHRGSNGRSFSVAVHANGNTSDLN